MMKNKWSIAKGFLLALAIVFLLAEAATFYWGMMYSGHGLARLRAVGAEEFATVRTHVFGIDDELDKLRDEVYHLIKNEDNDFQKALIVNGWVVDQVCGTGDDIDPSKRTPCTILTAMREGKTGASCAYRALLYLGVLKSIGIESRMITLTKSKGGNHATVEVLIDDEWQVIDPHFNVYYLMDGKPASAVELHQLLLGKGNNLKVIEATKVLRPREFGSTEYLLDYFYTVSIYERRHFFAWQALPILQYFFGVSDIHLDSENSPTENAIRMRNFMVLAYNFIFPIGFGISFIAFVATSRHKRQLVNKNRTRFD